MSGKYLLSLDHVSWFNQICNALCNFSRKWHEGTLLNIPGQQLGDVRLPDCVVFLTTTSEMREQHVGVKECAKLNIPTVGVVDSNCNPNQISYPVPGNDDSSTSVRLFANLFKEAILRGKRERQRRFDQYKKSIASVHENSLQ